MSKLDSEVCLMVDHRSSSSSGAVEVAVQGVRQLLGEEKRDGNSAVAARHCQALHHRVQQLVKAVERQQTTGSGSDGVVEATRELSDQLCVCFSTASSVLTLCKEVEAGSSWLFEDLSPHLATLFKATFMLIKTSTELLDTLPLTHRALENVVSSLQSLCAPVLNFDPSLHVLVWRGLGRTVCRGKSVFGDEWTIQPIISDICIAMETKAAECVQCAPRVAEGSSNGGTGGSGGPEYVKLLKLCRFLSSLLVKLVQEFRDCGTEYSADLTNLLIHLYGCVPPSPHTVPVTSHTEAELESNVLLVCEPVISALLDCSQFLKCLLSPASEDGADGRFGWLMCLCILLKNFPKLSDGLQDFVMDSVSSRESQSGSCLLLDAFFSCISQCGVELQLPVRVPGVMCNGEPQRAVSVSEHILTHFCCFIACLPHRHFPKVEALLFRHMLCGENTFTSLLAVDILTYIARCEERLADRYANLLAQLVQSSMELSSRVSSVAYMALQRMVPLLSPPHQALFTQAHPPSSHTQLSLWAYCDLNRISNPLRTQVAEQLWSSSIALITTQLQSGHPDLPTLHWSLQCLHSSYPHLPTSTPPSSHITSLTHTWDWIAKQDINRKWGAEVVCDGVVLMADCLPHLPPHNLLKVFNSLRDMITRGIPIVVCLAVTELLLKCGGLKLSGNMQTPILRTLVFAFQRLLSQSSWLVLHHTLLAFRHFVEHTPHAAVVEECVPPPLNDVVVEFLQCCPHLTSSRPDMKLTSFWVGELRERGEREARWRRGEREGEKRDVEPPQHHHHGDLVASKIQLLFDTWHELCTLTLPPATCAQLHDLCTSIQSHISQYSPHSPMQQ